MSTYQKPTTIGGKISEKIVVTLVLLATVWFLWAVFFAPGGCRPGTEVTAAECGYE
jgi:hypothetical protein